jgi:hypothetical protein
MELLEKFEHNWDWVKLIIPLTSWSVELIKGFEFKKG